MNIPGLACLLLLLSACASQTPDTQVTQLDRVILSNQNLTLHLDEIDTTVKPGASFRPPHYADNNQPPEINRLAKIGLTELSRLSQGMPITIYQHGDKTPLHGYLVLYVVYKTKDAPGQYKISLTQKQLQRARRGNIVLSHDDYQYAGKTFASWTMWLANQSLEGDCGCM